MHSSALLHTLADKSTCFYIHACKLPINGLSGTMQLAFQSLKYGVTLLVIMLSLILQPPSLTSASTVGICYLFSSSLSTLPLALHSRRVLDSPRSSMLWRPSVSSWVRRGEWRKNLAGYNGMVEGLKIHILTFC